MRPLREPRLGHPYPCCFSSSYLLFSSLQHVDIASSLAPLPTFSSLCMTVYYQLAHSVSSHLDSYTPIVSILSVHHHSLPRVFPSFAVSFSLSLIRLGLMQMASSLILWFGLVLALPKERGLNLFGSLSCVVICLWGSRFAEKINEGCTAVFRFAAYFEQHFIVPRSTQIDRPYRYTVEVVTAYYHPSTYYFNE